MTTTNLDLSAAARDVFDKLIAQMSRAGRAVDLEGCARLAEAIQEKGHRDSTVGKMARRLGLDPRWLPWKKEEW